MLKNLKNLDGVEQISKSQQKEIKGGYVPTLWQFCCTRTQGFWLSHYPWLNEFYACHGDIC